MQTLGETVTIGRIKGNIKSGQKIFRLQSKVLNDDISPTFKENKEFKKIKLNAILNIRKNETVNLEIFSNNQNSIYYGEKILVTSEEIINKAQNHSATKEDIISQISKTGNTPFEFENIEINLDNGLFVPVKVLNELRRNALEKLQNRIIEKHITSRNLIYKEPVSKTNNKIFRKGSCQKINLLLTFLNKETNYKEILNGLDKLYIPLKYFILKEYTEQVSNLCNNFNVYVYMPNIIRDIFKIDYDKIVDNFNIKGFIISSISQIELLKGYNLEMHGNYNLNVYNKYTEKTLKDLNLQSLCITPELNDADTINLINNSCLPLELWTYGNIPLMTMNYCLLGKSNKCYNKCAKLCQSNNKFYIKDRLGFRFRILPDNFWNLTKIYNSKITSFDYSNFINKYRTDNNFVNNSSFKCCVTSLRISILDETPSEIKQIIYNVKNNISFKGNKYCGHFNKSEI